MKTVRSSPRQSSTWACTSGIAANSVAMLRQNASSPPGGLTSGSQSARQAPAAGRFDGKTIVGRLASPREPATTPPPGTPARGGRALAPRRGRARRAAAGARASPRRCPCGRSPTVDHEHVDGIEARLPPLGAVGADVRQVEGRRAGGRHRPAQRHLARPMRTSSAAKWMSGPARAWPRGLAPARCPGLGSAGVQVEDAARRMLGHDRVEVVSVPRGAITVERRGHVTDRSGGCGRREPPRKRSDRDAYSLYLHTGGVLFPGGPGVKDALASPRPPSSAGVMQSGR